MHGTQHTAGQARRASLVAALWCAGSLTALLWLVAACGPGSPEDWVAKVESRSGTVSVMSAAQGTSVPAQVGQFISVGGRLETAKESAAVLALRNGGSITVHPNSVVLFRSDMPEKKINLLLEEGSVVGRGSGLVASELVIGVGERRVSLTAEAEAIVFAAASGEPRVVVNFGEASVVGPDGELRTVIAGDELELKPVQPDAGQQKPDAQAVVAETLVYYLQARGRGRLLVKRPGEARFSSIRQGQVIEISPGTELRLAPRAQAVVGSQKGQGTLISGPAQLVVREGPADSAGGQSGVRLENAGTSLQISEQGQPGTRGATLEVDGVTLTTRVTYKQIDVRVRREGGRQVVKVQAGEATLAGKDKTVRLEANEETSVRQGRIGDPQLPPAAPLQVKSGGVTRVFISPNAIPVTFRWKLPEGAQAALVEVARDARMSRPVFADVIQRQRLSLNNVPRGTLYWRVLPQSPAGQPQEETKGRLVLLRDTSHQRLKNRIAHRNSINQSDGDTEVYYQNKLPQFTFGWEAIEGASKYQFKLYREQNLSKPLVTYERSDPTLVLPAGRLGEGSYLWYVVGRGRDDRLVRATKGRRLSISYDNATPDLQIIQPRNGLAVAEGTIEARGVTMPGSQVFINGESVELDSTYRFTHNVQLKAGLNTIIFRVVDARSGSSYYLRHVKRQ